MIRIKVSEAHPDNGLVLLRTRERAGENGDPAAAAEREGRRLRSTQPGDRAARPADDDGVAEAADRERDRPAIAASPRASEPDRSEPDRIATSHDRAAARGGPATGLAALAAQRLLDGAALRIAPALAAALISYSHIHNLGAALIIFASVLAAAHLFERSRFPLDLMPAARVLIGVAVPLSGTALAVVVLIAAGASYPLVDAVAVVLGSWLVIALGAWFQHRFTTRIPARVAVIGSREFAADLAHELATAGIDRYDVVGWIAGEGPHQYRRLSWLGPLDEVREAVIAERIELLVCDPGAADVEGLRWEEIWERVADACLDLPVSIIDGNQLYEETLGHVPVGMIDAAWYRYIMHPRFRPTAPLSKRVFDLVVATAIGIVFLPVLIAAAIAIKLEDRGPILYRQRRLGENGREFEMLKLRTMREDADVDFTQWADPEDARITRVGRFLRDHHLNEIPQLWNVLRGDMTLVGPRPELPEMVAQLERKFPHYTRRHLVKPGVAGWAALRCGYAGSDLGAAWTLCHDLFYIKHRSVLADMLILAETAVEVFRDAQRAVEAPPERFLVGKAPDHG